MKLRSLLCVSLLLAAVFFAACTDAPAPSATVEISEVVSSNELSLEDDEYGSADWIELHNTGKQQVSLNGWFLTDKYSSLDPEFALPNIVLPPDGYCVIFASRNYEGTGHGCLPFGINKDGEKIYLYDPNGKEAAMLEVPALEKDVSWAARPDGSYGYCLVPTPGRPNDTEILTEMPVPPEEEEPDPDVPPDSQDTGNEPLVLAPSEIQLKINEISSVSGSDETDWIEIFNPTGEAVDLTGFFLSDNPNNPQKAELPALKVEPHGFLVIPLGPNADSEKGINTFSISSAGETLSLYDTGLGVIDTVEIPTLYSGIVYARAEDGSFGYAGIATPGAANNAGVWPAVLREMEQDSPIHINEGLYRNRYSAIDTYGDHSDWIELVNRSGKTQSLEEYYVSDDANNLTKWKIPQRELAPGEYLLIFLSGRESTENELHAPFSVSSGDQGCFLYSKGRLERELLPYPKDLIENVSVGLDEKGELVYFAYPTPGFENAKSFPDQQAKAFPTGDIMISEVSAGGEKGDWIELYNRSKKSQDISGWTLSDGSSKDVVLSKIKVPGHGYQVISLSKDSAKDLFSIALSGEELILSDGNGVAQDVFRSGALRRGYTSGRVEDDPSFERVFFKTATPGKKNSNDRLDGYAPKPVFSDMSLYHDESFQLMLTVSDPDAVIHYTLDGSKPTAKSPVYSKPLEIKKNTVVTAVATMKNRFSSDTVGATYLFRKPHTIPVMCLATDPAQWKQLTQVPYVEAGLEERIAWLVYYEQDGTLGTSFPAGISPRGNASLSYPQKSLSIHLRSEYGQASVSYPFWGKGSFLSYKFLVLRNGSQDIGGARLRDSFASRAAENLHVMAAKTRHVIVYVNGQYYGLMDLNEGMNQDYLWTHFQSESKDVNIAQRNDHVKHGSADGFVALRKFAAGKNLSDPKIMEQFSQKVNMDAIIDYIIAQSFFGNYDIHNQNWWNTTDGKVPWQPFLYDVDRCLNKQSFSSNVLYMYFNRKGIIHDRQGDRIYMEIPCGLRENAQWRERFVSRYAELLQTELSEKRMHTLLDEMAGEMRPEMKEHIDLWKTPGSVSTWERNVKDMHQNITNRYAYISTNIKRLFSISDKEWEDLLAKYA